MAIDSSRLQAGTGALTKNLFYWHLDLLASDLH